MGSNLAGQLGAAARDMAMAATLEDDRREALERHAVNRFWNAIQDGRPSGMEKASVRVRDGK